MNKIAILIIAHKNQEQLELLINSLDSKFQLYIHVDLKSSINTSYLREKYTDVYFYSKFDIVWSGFNQIQCPLFLFKEAYKNKHPYYILISGQDIPIKSNDEIIDFLHKQNQSFVVSDKLPLPQWKFNGGLDRVQLYWESDIIGNSILAKIKRRIIGNIRKRQRINNWRRSLYKGMQYYGGCNWVILKEDVLGFLLNFIKDNPKYIKSFKYSYCGDELWIQTILATSDCNTVNDHFTYLDWSKGPEYPRTLRMEDYEDIINSPYLFARKFDLEIDAEVVHKILELTKT